MWSEFRMIVEEPEVTWEEYCWMAFWFIIVEYVIIGLIFLVKWLA